MLLSLVLVLLERSGDNVLIRFEVANRLFRVGRGARKELVEFGGDPPQRGASEDANPDLASLAVLDEFESRGIVYVTRF